MPLTTLDPTPALVVIDLQRGIGANPLVHPFDDVVGRAVDLAGAFHRRGFPVVWVNVDGGAPGRTETPRPADRPADWAQLVDAIQPLPEDIRITKQRWGAWHDTRLDEELRARGVTQVMIVGVATSMGVESTARGAHERGYNVVLVSDAMTDRNIEVHENSIQRVFPKLGEVTTSDKLIAALAE
ncbi:MAG: isochorismatase family protein [Thermoleophilia bacterium]